MVDIVKDIQVLRDRLDKATEKDLGDEVTIQLLHDMLKIVDAMTERLETLENQVEMLSEK